MKSVIKITILSLFLVINVALAFTSQSKPAFLNNDVSLEMTKLNFGGKMVDAKAGSPLKNACAKAGFKPKYSCRKGDCGSCTISVGGTRVKACVGKVPPEPRLKSLQEKGLVVK